MQAQQQEQQPNGSQGSGQRRPAIVIVGIVLTLIALVSFVIVLAILLLNYLGAFQKDWSTTLTKIFGIVSLIAGPLAAALGAWRWFREWLLSRFPLEAPPQSIPQSYRHILGRLPPTDPKAVEQREELVKDIYEKLIRPDVTAITLTAIAGAGKSTLAGLVYQYAEKLRRRHRSFLSRRPFTSQALWLKIDASTTLIDIAGTLFECLGKHLPTNFATLTSQDQARRLMDLLDSTKRGRLIILDQFDTLFNIQTGHARSDHPGIGEWLDAINGGKGKCRILFTSCAWLQGSQVHPRTYMQEYHMNSLGIEEVTELLRKQGVRGTEAELYTIMEHCQGHALALTELTFLLQKYELSLSTFLENEIYLQLWRRNIASHFLNTIFMKQLNELEQRLLSAFAIYREPVPLDAVLAILSLSTNTAILSSLDVLLTQHLLTALGNGCYKLHPLIADYLRHELKESSRTIDQWSVQEMHSKAATYYRQQTYPISRQRQSIGDIHPLLEAIWHLSRAEQWQELYNLMISENIPADLRNWGEHLGLLQLYQLLLPLEKWHPGDSLAAEIYSDLGKIHADMGQRELALEYYRKSSSLYKKNNEVTDQSRQYKILQKIGRVYLADRSNYNVALAFFLEAGKFAQERNLDKKVVQNCVEELRKNVGDKQFAALLQEVETRSQQIVERLLYEDKP